MLPLTFFASKTVKVSIEKIPTKTANHKVKPLTSIDATIANDKSIPS